MLRRIDLRHFKCFTLLKLPLCPLTLLSGANASGKSSVLQALALLHQTMREHEWSSRLMLNGAAVLLGTVADVFDQMHGRRSVGITLLDDEQEFQWVQWECTGERTEMSMEVARVRSVHGGAGKDEPKLLRLELPRFRGPLTIVQRRCPDGRKTCAVRAAVPSPDGGVGAGRSHAS